MFYDNFIRLCEQRGEKPSPVAQKLGCTTSNVALWKKGSTPRPAVLQRFAEYFGVSTQELLFGDKKEPATTVSHGDRPDKDAILLEWFHSLPEEKRQAILALGDAPKELF